MSPSPNLLNHGNVKKCPDNFALLLIQMGQNYNYLNFGDIFQNLMHSTSSERIYNCAASFWDHSHSNLLLLLLSKMLEWTGWMDTRVGYAVVNHAGKRSYALIIFQIRIVYSDQYIHHMTAYMRISAEPHICGYLHTRCCFSKRFHAVKRLSMCINCNA